MMVYLEEWPDRLTVSKYSEFSSAFLVPLVAKRLKEGRIAKGRIPFASTVSSAFEGATMCTVGF